MKIFEDKLKRLERGKEVVPSLTISINCNTCNKCDGYNCMCVLHDISIDADFVCDHHYETITKQIIVVKNNSINKVSFSSNNHDLYVSYNKNSEDYDIKQMQNDNLYNTTMNLEQLINYIQDNKFEFVKVY